MRNIKGFLEGSRDFKCFLTAPCLGRSLHGRCSPLVGLSTNWEMARQFLCHSLERMAKILSSLVGLRLQVHQESFGSDQHRNLAIAYPPPRLPASALQSTHLYLIASSFIYLLPVSSTLHPSQSILESLLCSHQNPRAWTY